MKIKKINIKELNPAHYNPRQISVSEMNKLIKSIEEYGNVQPLVVNSKNMSIISGHQRLQACIKLGYTQVDCVLINIDDRKEKALNLAMNRISGDWDFYKLKGLLAELDSLAAIDMTGFEKIEVDNLMGKLNSDSFFNNPSHNESPKPDNTHNNPTEFDFLSSDSGGVSFSGVESGVYEPVEFIPPDNYENESIYTKKIEAPIYEPKNEKPEINDLLDDSKYKELVEEIKKSSLQEEEKNFLITAAMRHIIFDYEKIADFYAHSDQEIKNLMEKSALVIIDFNKALENGYLKLSKQTLEQFGLEYPNGLE